MFKEFIKILKNRFCFILNVLLILENTLCKTLFRPQIIARSNNLPYASICRS